MSLWLLNVIALLPVKWQNLIFYPSSIRIVEDSLAKVQLSRVAHVYFDHANLNVFTNFAKDFGFVEAASNGRTICYRGYGRDPCIYVASQCSNGRSLCCKGRGELQQSGGNVWRSLQVSAGRRGQMRDADI